MSGRIIDGKAVAARVRADVAAAVKQLPAQPALAVVLVGDDPASQVYVASKGKMTTEVGMRSVEIRLPKETTQDELIARVAALSADPEIDGILVQLPLPKHISEPAVLAVIDPMKDVDGLTEASAGKLVLGGPGLRPCTPVGCVILAKTERPDLTGANVVVIGRSILVGKPAALLFLEQNATVTIAHSKTRDLKMVCRSADILVAAVGRPEMVRGDWVRPGAIVIDVGTNRVPAPEKGEGKTKLVGDVCFPEAIEVAAAVTPSPGGVGPMTIACLLRNTVLAACARRGWTVPEALAAG
ncbi:bifunctional methylenetetrahydrofolate dehydrogenase/methenyltetrahydrofolate cyclohydrolase FolD [Terricaulis sp.]|uniref:bifunctional methylenetetrahydrofolate dehydrogenase/methenyltetrahydrofolate cyclohydrolase FolD n=1 Tax=Terricaulis sp. TaxID=2768686 RepID=UPI002AC61CDA|nr:bifunctional methylenetetrahydrofolate dehydrogenase/methenyltetrahydrofolate cyclohydrolase FolD [Terricaulis sp.]MDZ4691287.1 bifunctional methylenetetrahydrofolate dehydrogenase/methenyltetrahydrofolate cyclohydrolase FolD [Terricaulis sp.]